MEIRIVPFFILRLYLSLLPNVICFRFGLRSKLEQASNWLIFISRGIIGIGGAFIHKKAAPL